MGYGMKYTKGGFPFKSPAKQKVDPDAPGTPGTPGFEPPVTSMDYLTKKPNPTTQAVHDFSGVDQNELTKQDMENKQDFNISNLHKDTKASLKDKNYTKHSDLEKHDDDRPVSPPPSFKPTLKGSKKRSKAENNLEKSEDEKGL